MNWSSDFGVSELLVVPVQITSDIRQCDVHFHRAEKEAGSFIPKVRVMDHREKIAIHLFTRSAGEFLSKETHVFDVLAVGFAEDFVSFCRNLRLRFTQILLSFAEKEKSEI